MMNSTVKPVRRFKSPGYPTHDYLFDHPELLRLIPKRWRGNRLALAVLGSVAFLLAASRELDAQDDLGGPLRQPNSRIAPLFAHGDGVGSFGCESVAPPVYLSEAEAREIISNEAAKAGVHFTPTSLLAPEIKFPYQAQLTRPGPDGWNYLSLRDSVKTLALELDGYDDSLDVAFEYVSSRDHADMDYTFSASTVQTDDIKQTAEKLQRGLQGAYSKTRIGIFYDPVTYDWNWSFDPRAASQARAHPSGAEKESQELLRAQVRDFIQWLKAQGVI